MELHTEKIGNVTLVTPLVKRIDAFSSTSFKGSIGDLIISGEKLLLLKMNSLEFIDSSALGALISVLKTAASFKGNIALCGVSPPILNLLQMTRLDKIVSIFDEQNKGMEFLENWNATHG